MGVQIVWFKRDLRVFDHEPLFMAVKSGSTIPLYIFEPALWQQPDMSGRHFDFLVECLRELDNLLTALGQPLVIRVGEARHVLKELHQEFSIDALWSHQETWNGWTYTRDLDVKQWCKSEGITWNEPAQHGVKRGGNSREEWASRWDILMTSSRIPRPIAMDSVEVDPGQMPTLDEFGIHSDECPGRQIGGRSNGIAYLRSFLFERGKHYQKGMSSPLTAFDTCSRLSPYLAFGALSVREVYQKAVERKKHLADRNAPQETYWNKAIPAFISRLYWHCHFIQKLEDEPELEFRSLHPSMAHVRDSSFNEDFFEAWRLGKTGIPFVDACMRALTATGWLNFRMRAMLMSFATYQLWLPWQKPALHLARLFIDYEPGIHYSQCQMQSGTTGINSIRIYNPIKQGLEHDAEALFIKKWVPELRLISPARIHEVKSIHSFCPAYPAPIVDERNSRKHATQRVFAIRNQPDFEARAQRILRKHGSRKAGLSHTAFRSITRKKKPAGRVASSNQLKLPL